MKRPRGLGLIAGLGLLILSLSAPTAVFASDTTNYAGRPINGSSNDWSTPYTGAPRQWMDLPGGAVEFDYNYGYGTCFGIAYAKINGNIALLHPHHCRSDASFTGKNVFGKNDTKIGTWGTNVCIGSVCANDYDLAVIWMDYENLPGNLNRVYRGDVAGDDWWTITDPIPEAFDCSNLTYGGPVAQNWQQYATSDIAYRTGVTTGFYEGANDDEFCSLKTNLAWHGPSYRDSGTPFIDTYYPNTIFGFGHVKWNDNGTTKVVVKSLEDGMDFLDDYWDVHGNNVGAHICKTSDCS